ncbi:MAG: hypothetical protein JJV98_11265 [Desulfosarcina sp.]|nr:hypothetical protein [Desulfobacterales bacterium]
MSDEASRNVDSELANRLDTLFEGDEAETAHTGGKTADPLDELKSLVMSIEWEITDDIMERFVSHGETLKKRYKEDRILVMFLQLLGSLGLYVKSNKGKAHPKAFNLLNTVYASFSNAAIPGKISSSEKKKLLYIELNQYKELKEQIEISRDSTRERPLEKPRSSNAADQTKSDASDNNEDKKKVFDKPPPGQTAVVTLPQFEEAIAAIRQLIRDEFKNLRETLIQQLKG